MSERLPTRTDLSQPDEDAYDPVGAWFADEADDLPASAGAKVVRLLAEVKAGQTKAFDEHRHPRDNDGKFARVPGSRVVRKLGAVHTPNSPKQVSAFTGIKRTGRPDGAGTPEDPIAVGHDLDKAARLLGEGKHVRLETTEEVGTLVGKLAELVHDAEARGDKAPTYDLCKVSVPKTNLFCQQSKGVPRANMPQLAGTPVPGTLAWERAHGDAGAEVDLAADFRDDLEAHGFHVTSKKMPASHLKASQSELNGAKVAGITAAMRSGKLPPGSIFVTRDGYILDGHHRWAAAVTLDTEDGHLGDVEMDVKMIDMDIGAAIDYANAYTAQAGIAPKGVAATKGLGLSLLNALGELVEREETKGHDVSHQARIPKGNEHGGEFAGTPGGDPMATRFTRTATDKYRAPVTLRDGRIWNITVQRTSVGNPSARGGAYRTEWVAGNGALSVREAADTRQGAYDKVIANLTARNLM